VGDRENPPRRIPRPPPVLDLSPVTFSFKYLDVQTNPKFLFALCDMQFLECLIEELRRLSSGTVSEFCEWDNDRHSHAIRFDETTEPNGFAHMDEQLDPEEPWQFGIRANRAWRVHGFFIDSVFYIVWLDPMHNLHAG
jgi:hypothetical protein